MTWFKVDDKLHDHRKTRRAGKSAMGVWVLAGSWCAANLTDGFVPSDMLKRWGTAADAKRLVEFGLWAVAEKEGEKGWLFHDWLDHQPDARTVRLKQEAESKGGSFGNHTRWHVRRRVKDPECPHCQAPNQVPDRGGESGPPIGGESPVPSRPVPSPIPTADESAAPAQKLVAEWVEHCPQRPPSRVIGQVAKELKALVGDGIPYEQIRLGLAAWDRKDLHPATLASVVHEQRPRNGLRLAPNGEPIIPFPSDDRR